jgi:hypothetical protein
MFYTPFPPDNFLQAWFWRSAYKLWTRLMNRFGRRSLRSDGFVVETISEQDLHKEDERDILSALLFLIEAAQESDDPRIASRAVRHAERIAIARRHRTGLDWVRELPEKLPYVEVVTVTCDASAIMASAEAIGAALSAKAARDAALKDAALKKAKRKAPRKSNEKYQHPQTAPRV